MTATPAFAASIAPPFGFRPTATSTRSYICGPAGAAAPSKATFMPVRVASADTVFVFSMSLSKRGAFFFSHTFTRSQSASVITPSSISTTSMRLPSDEYTFAISSPMMPPPTTSIRFGIDCRSSAPVESTMRGSSGMNGSFIASLPAAMIALSKRITFFAAVASRPSPLVSCTSR